jgi:hypothetical protein
MVRPIPGVRGEQRFDRNKFQAPECLLADLDLLHELEIGRFQQAADHRHGPLHNERVAGMQFQPPVGRHPFSNLSLLTLNFMAKGYPIMRWKSLQVAGGEATEEFYQDDGRAR